ncbi:entericidin A/B family lipoprotein [Pelagerythrobacter marinus]|jgi:predicted small secreted protein|uniref:Entericidin A/B family lipoprotein n=1 Tax=Pelagerythrobacter marinus TaxID=538382 RepID=A0ABW9UYE6_9SPHN|nr:entericidin A/B family lipoprotein [Pelagerythrobacter marinus]MEC9067696.1 entericidin A/B family lipoprotein [Pseudomonadota bacterium]MXO67717.1 entericidin A/B family lipoprotein [Pelagerythrobacter marinus]USA38257.1 entericidin A/B family lipoprotein [Pelagerythrobacter marinus]WPZ07781.1 entericidin A/B family lipoprotein [Pelagerythrobacter marinus]
MARKILIAFGIATMSLAATACNTVKGVGQDIESVGEAGDDAI